MKQVRQRGMALGIVLLLLLGLALLALAGHSAAVAALAIAGLEQHAARAFEAAEAGVSRTLRSWHTLGAASDAAPVEVWPETWPEVTILRNVSADLPGQPGAWPVRFSIGNGAGTFTSRHYTIVAEARGARHTAARVEQGFIIIEPTP